MNGLTDRDRIENRIRVVDGHVDGWWFDLLVNVWMLRLRTFCAKVCDILKKIWFSNPRSERRQDNKQTIQQLSTNWKRLKIDVDWLLTLLPRSKSNFFHYLLTLSIDSNLISVQHAKSTKSHWSREESHHQDQGSREVRNNIISIDWLEMNDLRDGIAATYT